MPMYIEGLGLVFAPTRKRVIERERVSERVRLRERGREGERERER